MTDTDGAFKYSPVVIVKFAGKNEVKISPVPANSYVMFTISDRSLVGQSAQVFSPAGNLVLALSNRIEIAHLPSGIYTIKTSSGTYRFIKQ
ncbi:MAG: T9SS type A sorting domain-containing protein [Pseudobacter sp.]|uniref:T9SS type A sorting domain-containing protein n=1 Tax=Pseudobacter sp. TaxID=2045420 RepID=UPI003F7F3251